MQGLGVGFRHVVKLHIRNEVHIRQGSKTQVGAHRFPLRDTFRSELFLQDIRKMLFEVLVNSREVGRVVHPNKSGVVPIAPVRFILLL